MSLREHFDAWQTLEAFKPRDFARCELVLRSRQGVATTGCTELRGRRRFRIVLRCGYDRADRHATLLHEMAHVVAGWRNGRGNIHTPRWRDTLLAAAFELTGQIPPPAVRQWAIHAVHDWVRSALKAQRQARA